MNRALNIGIGITALFAALVVLLTAGRHHHLAQQLNEARTEYQQLESGAAGIRAAKAALAANTAAHSHYERWQRGGGLPMHLVFQSLEKNIPAGMAVYHLEIGAEQEDLAAPLVCSVYISGVANGILSAVDVKKRFNSESPLRLFCGEMKLSASKRHSSKEWAFALKGLRVAGETAP
jgi:hypothetical protein